MCTSSVSSVIYHKFSHGAAFYTLNGKNVNVMLEYAILYCLNQFNGCNSCITDAFCQKIYHQIKMIYIFLTFQDISFIGYLVMAQIVNFKSVQGQ